MKTNFKLFLFLFILFFASFSFSQNLKTASSPTISLDPEKVAIYEKYLEYKHSFETGGYLQWKKDNPELYEKEMWYFSESFYITRNYLSQGITLNEGGIYVARFEAQRKQNEEAIVIFPGFKDVMVLLPGNKLIYKPN